MDTNQGLCNDDSVRIDSPSEGEAFYGQDAQYTGNVPCYTDNGDGTVTDNMTGLTWAQGLSESSMSWEDAVDYCENLTLGGYDDWRHRRRHPLIRIIHCASAVTVLCACSVDIQRMRFAILDWRKIMRLKLFAALLILCLLFSAFTGCGTTEMTTPSTVDSTTSGTEDSTTPGTEDGITPEATIAYPIVDTGVVAFYSDKQIISAPAEGEPFCGQDANYQGNSPSYTDNDDGTVTDNVTGLMWQQDMGKKMTYADAMKYAEECTLGGYDDWRVPTIKELYSLIQFTGECGGEVAGDELFIDTDYFKQPIGDTSIGEREIDAQTWSSTIYVGTTMNGAKTVFGVNFIDGRIKGYGYYKAKTAEENTAYFRLVRGNEEYGKNNFVDNGDGTITDLATGLMWQQSDSGRGMDWEKALSYAETLNLAGYDDWRLPNVKELQSIVDYTRSPSTTNSAAIDPLFKVSTVEDMNGNTNYPYFWSGTTHMTGKGTNKYTSAAYVAFGYAQGIMNDKLMDVHGAGCQRSDPKSGNTADYPKSHGPQGDIQNVFNYVRCVRSVDVFENKGNTANDKAETTTESF